MLEELADVDVNYIVNLPLDFEYFGKHSGGVRGAVLGVRQEACIVWGRLIPS